MKAKRKTKQNKYLDRLSEHLHKEYGLDITEVCKYMGINENSLEGKRGFPTKRTKDKHNQRPFRWTEAAMLKLGFNIPDEILVLEESDENDWKQENPNPRFKHFYREHRDENALITKWSPQNTVVNIVDLEYRYGSLGERQRFKNAYVNANLPFINAAERTIYVTEYLNKGTKSKRKVHLNAYQDAHDEIFEKGIEVKLRTNTNFRYSRVMTKHFSKEANTPALKIREVILECSVATFTHMVRSLNKFGKEKIDVKIETEQDRFKTEKRNRVRFCASPTIRSSHMGIIDSNLLFTETYLFILDEGESIQIPDILKIENCSSSDKLRNLVKQYELEMENSFIDNFCITSENIKSHSYEAMNTAKAISEVSGSKSGQEYDMEEKLEYLREYFT